MFPSPSFRHDRLRCQGRQWVPGSADATTARQAVARVYSRQPGGADGWRLLKRSAKMRHVQPFLAILTSALMTTQFGIRAFFRWTGSWGYSNACCFFRAPGHGRHCSIFCLTDPYHGSDSTSSVCPGSTNNGLCGTLRYQAAFSLIRCFVGRSSFGLPALFRCGRRSVGQPVSERSLIFGGTGPACSGRLAPADPDTGRTANMPVCLRRDLEGFRIVGPMWMQHLAEGGNCMNRVRW